MRSCRDNGFALLPSNFLKVKRDYLRCIPVQARGKFIHQPPLLAALDELCDSVTILLANTVASNYSNDSINSVVERKNGASYNSFAKASNPDGYAITSFNEWHEGTEIEPSQQYNDTYISLTNHNIKSTPTPPPTATPPPTPTPTIPTPPPTPNSELPIVIFVLGAIISSIVVFYVLKLRKSAYSTSSLVA